MLSNVQYLVCTPLYVFPQDANTASSFKFVFRTLERLLASVCTEFCDFTLASEATPPFRNTGDFVSQQFGKPLGSEQCPIRNGLLSAEVGESLNVAGLQHERGARPPLFVVGQ